MIDIAPTFTTARAQGGEWTDRARQLAPYRPRRSRADDGGQPPLFTLAPETATG